MIRSIWTVIATLSVANFAAIIALVAWLAATNRVSEDRVNTLRSTFTPTLAQEAAQQQAEEAARQQLQAELDAQGEVGDYPLDTETVMALWNERDAEARQRYQRELAALRHLREDVDQRREALEAEIARFQQRVQRFEQQEARIIERRSSEQFNQAVKLIALTDPDTARNMLQSLIDDGETQDVVNYLDALKPDLATPILDAFAEDDPALAARLLERVRTLGEPGDRPQSETPP